MECCDYFSGLHLIIVVIPNKTRALVFDLCTLHTTSIISLSNYQLLLVSLRGRG